MISLLLFMITAYLFGSLSSAIIICRLFHLPDPRNQGSGNPGATNVLRYGGTKVAILVLIGDLLKGLIPVLIAKWFGMTQLDLAWIGLAAIVGHVFPIFFAFHGGKGVATGAGALLGINWVLGLSVFSSWLIIAIVFRYSSLAAIIGAILVPVYAYWLTQHHILVPLILISLILLWRHAENIKRLLKGQEDKITFKKSNID